VLVDEPLRPLVARLGELHRAAVGAADVEHPEHRHEVLQAGRPLAREVLLDHGAELLRLLRGRAVAVVPLPGDHPRHGVQRELERARLHVDAGGRRSEQPARQVRGLGAADVGGAEKAMRGEHLDGGNAAEVAPVGAVAGGAQRGVAVGEVAQGGEPRAVGEGDVVGGQALLGDGGVGDVDHEAGAES
jgi:hypothetical protein